MEFIQLEVNIIENYIEVLNETIIQIKKNEERRMENVEELYKLYDLYRKLQTCYFAFSNAVERLRAIPIQIWSQCLIGEHPNMDLIGITNYLKRVDTFFKKFRYEIQNLPQLYWREVPPNAQVNCDESQKVLNTPNVTYSHPTLADSLIPPFQHRNPIQQTSISPNTEIGKKNDWPSTEQNIKINELIRKPVELFTKLKEASGLQPETIELDNCVEVLNNLTGSLALTAHESISEEMHLNPEENLNFTSSFVSCIPGSTGADKPIDLESESKTSTELKTLSPAKYEQVQLNNVDDEINNVNNSIDTGLKESYNISTVRVQSEDIEGVKENPNTKKLLAESSKDSGINILCTKEHENKEFGAIKEVINSLTSYSAVIIDESICHQACLDPEDHLDYFTSEDITSTTDSTSEVVQEIEHELNSDTEPETLYPAAYENIEYSSNDNDDLRIPADSNRKIQTEEIDEKHENDSNKELSAEPSKVSSAYIPRTGHENINVETGIGIVNNSTSSTVKLMCEQVLLDLEDTLNYFTAGVVSCTADSTEVDVEFKHEPDSSAELEVEFTPKENGDLRLCGDFRANSNNQIGQKISEVHEFVDKALYSCKLDDHALLKARNNNEICHVENPSNITIQCEIKDDKNENDNNNELLTESSKPNYFNISSNKGHRSAKVEPGIETGFSVFATSEPTCSKKYSNEEDNLICSISTYDASCNKESIVGSKEIEIEPNSATELATLSQDRCEQIKSSSDTKVRSTISESESCSNSDPPSCNDAGALGYPTVSSNELIEINLQRLSSQFNSSIEIDDSSNNSTVSTIEADFLPAVEPEMSASESQGDVRGYGIKEYLSNSMAGDASFATNSSSDPDAAPEQENNGPQASANRATIWALLDDVIKSALDNSSIDPSVDLSDLANPFYRSLLNQWKDVMINNMIDIKFIKSHYANDIFGFCRFITNAEDLQNLHLIRFVMAGNEISGIQLLSQLK